MCQSLRRQQHHNDVASKDELGVLGGGLWLVVFILMYLLFC